MDEEEKKRLRIVFKEKYGSLPRSSIYVIPYNSSLLPLSDFLTSVSSPEGATKPRTGSQIRKNPSYTHLFLACDFDQTLTMVKKNNHLAVPEPQLAQGAVGAAVGAAVTAGNGAGIRGGPDTLKFLQHLKSFSSHENLNSTRNSNVGEVGRNSIQATLAIITAQTPSRAVMKNLQRESSHLGLDSFFNCTAFNSALLKIHLGTWAIGNPESFNLESSLEDFKANHRRIMIKLMVLIVINSERYPCDLIRILKKVQFTGQDNAVALYKLKQQDNVLGGNIRMEDSETVAAWKQYLEFEKIMALYPGDDELLFGAITGTEVLEIFETVLKEAGIDERERQKLMVDPIQEIRVKIEGGDQEIVNIAKLGNTMAAKYNKPEAFEWFIEDEERKRTIVKEAQRLERQKKREEERKKREEERKKREEEMKKKEEEEKEGSDASSEDEDRRLYWFIDDNSDNVMNMFLKFADKEIKMNEERERKREKGEKLPDEIEWQFMGFWYQPPPPPWGEEEHVDEWNKELLLQISKCVPMAVDPAVKQ